MCENRKLPKARKKKDFGSYEKYPKGIFKFINLLKAIKLSADKLLVCYTPIKGEYAHFTS
jgi:hypothetical protein